MTSRCHLPTFLIVKKNYLNNLDPNQLKLWIFIFYGYPLIETIIKIFIYFNIIPYSYDALNIAEHAFWAFCMTIYLLPFFKSKSNFGIIHAIALLGIVILIGNINEFVELAIRMAVFRKTTAEYWSLAYFDTMRDLLMNIAGSSLGIAFLTRSRSKQKDSSKVLSF